MQTIKEACIVRAFNMESILFIVCSRVIYLLVIELRALHIVDKLSTTEQDTSALSLEIRQALSPLEVFISHN